MKTRIRIRREVLGLTQADIARKAKITERNYQRIEQGEQEPSVHKALLMAHALNTTVEELFGAATPTTDDPLDNNNL